MSFHSQFPNEHPKIVSCFVKCTVSTVFVNCPMNPLAHSNAGPGLVVKNMGASHFYTQTNLNGKRWTCPLPWSYDSAEQNYLSGIVGIEFYVPFNGHIFGHDVFKKVLSGIRRPRLSFMQDLEFYYFDYHSIGVHSNLYYETNHPGRVSGLYSNVRCWAIAERIFQNYKFIRMKRKRFK